jgi:hypothetical protein
MSCFPCYTSSEEAAEAYLLHRMPGHVAAAFELHVRSCGCCSREVEATSAFVNAAHQLAEFSPGHARQNGTQMYGGLLGNALTGAVGSGRIVLNQRSSKVIGR